MLAKGQQKAISKTAESRGLLMAGLSLLTPQGPELASFVCA